MLDSYVHSLGYRVVHEGRTLMRAWCHRNEANLTLCSMAGGHSIFSLSPKTSRIIINYSILCNYPFTVANCISLLT